MTGPDAGRDTDLERIETALADGRATAADPRERELQELALALRADSHEPEPRFERDLDRRVRDGFPRQRRARLALPSVLRGGWRPALAGAAALVIAVVVAAIVLGGGESDRQPAAGVALKAPSGVAPTTALITPAPGASSAAATGRRVERSARVTISTTRDRLQEAADGVGTVTADHGGFVVSSHVDTGDQTSPGGSFVLRVPSRELQATLADLSRLGHLRARSESGQDITVPFRQVQDRLGSDLVERRALRVKLRHAHGRRADAIRTRIVRLSAEIAGLGGEMHDLRSRASYSTVAVTLEQQAGASGGIGAAWHDTRRTLGDLLAFSVRALGVLLPLALLAVAAAFGTRALRRRRREAALF
jgi:hypothetical protein